MLLTWAITSLVIALVTAVLGFWGLAFVAATVARALFGTFLVLALLSLLAHAGYLNFHHGRL